MEGSSESTPRKSQWVELALRSTEHIQKAHDEYSYWGMIVYGPLRCGKSMYAIRLLSEVYGETYYDPRVVDKETGEPRLLIKKRNWDAWKEYMVFFPEDFFKLVEKAQNSGRQQKVIVWDDAGLWASQYRWAEEFAKRLSEYMNVLATDFSSIVFTTPDPTWLLKYIRDLPGGHNGRPFKTTGNPKEKDWRNMTIYEGWLAPDLKKTGVSKVAEEHFKLRIPDQVFAEYDQIRRSYARIAKDRCIELLQRMRWEKPSRAYADIYEKRTATYGIDLKSEDGVVK